MPSTTPRAQKINAEEQASPFLRWAGSKRKQLPILSQFWNAEFSRYVEPFMGSACLFFALQPKKALLSDINEDLVRTFKTIQDHPRAVSNRLVKIRKGKRSFYSVRKQQPSELTDVDAAARFIFLNRFCFNGLYRTNEAGMFNVPFASSGTGELPSAADLQTVSKALRIAAIKCSDFEDILKKTKPGDLVYLDPPYAVGNRRVFRQYGPASFGLEDLERLSESLVAMDNRGVKFVLSYAYCSEALRQFRDWPKRKLMVQRNIAGFAHCRRMAAEIVVSNIE